MKLSLLVGGLVALGITGLVIANDAPVETKPAEAAYLGADKCKMCHAKQHATWMKMKHSTAIESLSAEEQKKPECVKCHVTGFGKTGGFESMGKTPKMANVQCEACHNAGSLHMKSTAAEKKKTINGPGVDCRECHSPHVDGNRKKGAAEEKKEEAKPEEAKP
ncbi:MAG: cytochrome c family protein [Elusimicrobia bacterium]|nr:cytochrome c family protein [Elusimicrobiota bacterium]